MMNEPISIQDFRREEAKHDAEHFPAECRESFANIARATVRRWSKGNDPSAWYRLADFPVVCRNWLLTETGEFNSEFTNQQIASTAAWCLMVGGDHASDSLTEWLADWLWRGEQLR